MQGKYLFPSHLLAAKLGGEKYLSLYLLFRSIYSPDHNIEKSIRFPNYIIHKIEKKNSRKIT